MGLIRVGTLIRILPIIFFFSSIGLLFEKEWGPAGLGFVLSFVLFYFLYVRGK